MYSVDQRYLPLRVQSPIVPSLESVGGDSSPFTWLLMHDILMDCITPPSHGGCTMIICCPAFPEKARAISYVERVFIYSGGGGCVIPSKGIPRFMASNAAITERGRLPQLPAG